MSKTDDELAQCLRKARAELNALPAEERDKLTSEDLLRLSVRVVEAYHAELVRRP